MSRSPSPTRAPEAQVSNSNSLERIFSNAKALVDNIYFSLNSLVDVSQIRTYEDMYRVLDNHVSLLLPFIGL